MKRKVAITVGCFDLLHRGHLNLFKQMEWIADEIYVGVHDDESIFLNKNYYTNEKYEQRAQQVKKVVDNIFKVNDADPSVALEDLINRLVADEVEICFVRANDWPEFPGRSVIEKFHIPIFLVPYTIGISSTMLKEQRKEK